MELERFGRAREAIQNASRILEIVTSPEPTEILIAVRAAMAELEKAEQLLAGDRRAAAAGKGARGRILSYFLEKGIDLPVSGPELRRISGIQEWARRVRELRVEEGWDIRYDGDVYRLKADAPNREVAQAWRLATEVRGTTLSATDRILRYLQARVGDVVRLELISYAAATQQLDPLISDLRCRLGYAVSTKGDRPELASDEVVLEEAQPFLREADRTASPTLRKTVLERDGYMCVLCERKYGAALKLFPYRLDDNGDDESELDPEGFVSLCRDDYDSITADQVRSLAGRRRKRISSE